MSIIIPTLNEEKGIVKTLKQINKLDIEHETLVVDGLSSDNTIKNAKKYGAKVIIEKRRGKGIAMRTGVEKSKGNIICFLDGDGTYPPQHIPKMMKLVKDCDVVVASRLLKKENANDSLYTLFLYRFYPLFLKNYFKKFKTSEPITGMRMLRKNTWNKLNLKSNDFMIELEMEVSMAKNKMKVIEIPIPCLKRAGGRSKFFYPRNWKTVWNMRKYVKQNEPYLKDLNVVRII